MLCLNFAMLWRLVWLSSAPVARSLKSFFVDLKYQEHLLKVNLECISQWLIWQHVNGRRVLSRQNAGQVILNGVSLHYWWRWQVLSVVNTEDGNCNAEMLSTEDSNCHTEMLSSEDSIVIQKCYLGLLKIAIVIQKCYLLKIAILSSKMLSTEVNNFNT